RVELQRRVFLIGPNASGKSNFLGLFRFLHDLVSVGGGFQEAVRKRRGISSLRCLAARGTLRLMGRLWIALAGGGPLLLEEPELNLHPERCSTSR
ncbi:MAG: ATP-binding protein, partial [Gammaproteobacteria bacterium]|nr:ATP-binding protein [Gammaproteobacteria bacterium]